jgi:nicotinate-nucleotide adenylyltransferase
MKKVGILGGTFDPPHIGHFLIARDVFEALSLDEMYFLVSFSPPHRRIRADFEHRIRMTELMLKNTGFVASDFESRLKFSPTYTAFVMEEWRRKNPEDDIYFIMGSDQFINFSSWSKPDLLMELTNIVVIERSKFPIEEDLPYINRIIRVKTRIIEVSSKEIRRRIKERKSIHLMVHPEVEEYIKENKLYL